MTTETIVYKVRNTKTGEFRTAGGGYSKTGKTWDNLGHLKSSLSSDGWYTHRKNDVPGDEFEIVSVVVRCDEGNTRPLKDLIQRERKKRELSAAFGHNFATLVERIEDKNQNNDFQWVLIIKSHFMSQALADAAEILAVIKRLKLRQNIDYKKSVSGHSGAFAFSTKQIAMMVRLNIKAEVRGVDIVQYVETDLDAGDSTHV